LTLSAGRLSVDRSLCISAAATPAGDDQRGVGRTQRCVGHRLQHDETAAAAASRGVVGGCADFADQDLDRFARGDYGDSAFSWF
jgi:hypothetical protein